MSKTSDGIEAAWPPSERTGPGWVTPYYFSSEQCKLDLRREGMRSTLEQYTPEERRILRELLDELDG